MKRHALGATALQLALGAALGTLCALAPPAVPVAVAALLLVAIPLGLGVVSQRPWDEARPLLLIFVAALVVRAGVALSIHFLVSDTFFALDDDKYALLGGQLAEHWSGTAPFPPELYGRIGYYAWNALLFMLFGHVPLVPTLLNGVIGAAGVLVAYAIARDMAGHRAGLLAAALAAFWPSLVLWSSLNLKDAPVILGILLVLRGAQRLGARGSRGAWLQLAAGFALLTSLRGYLTLVAALAALLAWVLPRLRTAPLTTAALVGVAAVLLVSLGPLQELGDEASFESLDRTRRKLALGGSAYHGDVDLSTPGSALGFLPTGLGYFLLAPAPWQLWNKRQLLTLPEMLLWYAMLPYVLRGFVGSLRRSFAVAAPTAIFAVLATLSYALAEGNLGTAYRHRAQVVVLFLIFAATALARRGERAPATQAATLRVGAGAGVPAEAAA